MTHDFNLRIDDVQSLHNREAIVTFFGMLGYNTQARVPHSPASLGITAESVVQEIKHIEQIADQEGFLKVFLVELSSVTIALTNALARSFRTKQGEYFLVLTSDYERIDFVFLERSAPVPSHKGRGSVGDRSGTIHPRTLSIDRRRVNRRQLRVLRRFTYTEPDVFYQLEKLRSAYSIFHWSEEHFNNYGLFSDYYLLERSRDRDEWQQDVRSSFQNVRALYDDALIKWSGKDEAALRTGVIEPLFELLGFAFKEVKKPNDASTNPDYLLYAHAGGEPIAACLCYSWGRSLDGRDERDSHTPEENPSAVVVSTLKSSSAPWAIVTNGKLWRLYYGKSSSIATTYYEIDLLEILSGPEGLGTTADSFDLSTSFKYFDLFFSARAFSPLQEQVAGEERKTSFLESLIRGSEEYAKALGERLKDRTFEDIFPYLARGFIDYMHRNGEKRSALTQDQLDEVYRGTLTLLYRLLFLLYSESRDLLPVKEARGYFEKSLTKLRCEIAELAGTISDLVPEKLGKHFSASTTQLYDRLLDLFVIIDQGDAALNIPMYNGGLFFSNPGKDDTSDEAKAGRFLRDTKVPDRYLALGLDLLARDEDEKSRSLVFVDYRSLGVRQLGSIYEGLLEFKLRIAPEKMAVVKGKKTEEIVPYQEAINNKLRILTERRNGQKIERVYPKGTLYLENDKRERKATGSYYTPDYIVKYIVENTVGPVLGEKFEKLAPQFRKAQQTYREAIKRRDAFIKQGMKPDDPDLSKWAHANTGLVDQLFDVKVLDPAMGSGHFLVDAADFISDRLIDFLNGFPANPVVKMLEDTRRTILEEMEKQRVSIETGKLTDVNLIKRHVLKRCIYGVDLNPMAVELAKVSLWLNCFTLGAPLSFLDHHLKCGNSLIGATVEEVQEKIQTGQLMLGGTEFTGLMLATDLMRHVGELSDVTAEQVRESQREYRKASDALAPFKRILDVYTSRWFGNDVRTIGRGKKKREVDPAVEFLQSSEGTAWLKRPDTTKLTGEWKKVSEIASRESAARRFFHWELEFPEVFYERGDVRQDRGFDVVIGNPPYVGVEVMAGQNKSYCQAAFSSATGRFDLYFVFLEKSLQLCASTGRVSMITPNKYFVTQHAQSLRKLLYQRGIVEIRDFKDFPVFGEAIAYPAIVVIGENRTTPTTYVDCSKWPRTSVGSVSDDVLKSDKWIFAAEVHTSLTQLRKVSVALGELTEHTFEGLITGHNDIFILTSLEASSHGLEKQALHRCPKGASVERYVLLEEPNYVIYPYTVSSAGELEPVDLGAYPNLNRYLLANKKVLSQRRSLRDSSKSWYEHVRPRNPAWFSRTKIFVPNLANRSRFHFDDGKDGFLFLDHDCYGIALKPGEYDHCMVLALLNSSLLEECFLEMSAGYRGGYVKFHAQYLHSLPIRRIHFTTPQEERSDLLGHGKRLYEQSVANANRSSVTELVEELLPKDEEGNFLAFKEGATGAEEKSDVVHDLLAFLAEEMIRLNKEKQAEIKRFLGWLQKKTRMPEGMDSLSGKTIIKNYLGDYQKNESEMPFEEILKVLQKNKGKLGVSLSQPKLVNDLRQEYESSLAKLLPLKRTLAATDRLIDEIVYRLYGLTDEEVKIVEGKS